MDVRSSIFQRFVALGRTCWLVSWGEASRFAGLQLDTSRLPHSEAVLSIRDWHAATSPWNPDPGTLHSAQTLRSLIAATEEDRVRVYEQRRPSVRGAPLEPTDHTDLLVADASRSVSHWVEVRLTGESDEARA
ncbi:MAG: hypothetical protein KUG77_27225 [Nannocystaceae bacterium]|nr:hypothetical protein [Nannocystaceae bacterium]